MGQLGVHAETRGRSALDHRGAQVRGGGRRVESPAWRRGRRRVRLL